MGSFLKVGSHYVDAYHVARVSPDYRGTGCVVATVDGHEAHSENVEAWSMKKRIEDARDLNEGKQCP